MVSYFSSWRQRAAACGAGFAAMASTSALAAPIDIHWPEITLTWPPSTPDMLLIGSGLVVVLVLLFAFMRSGSSRSHRPPAAHSPDLRWWKNPSDPRDHIDPMSMPR